MTLHNCTLRVIEGKYFIDCYPEGKPELKNVYQQSMIGMKLYFKGKKEKWIDSKQTITVHPDSVEAFKKLAYQVFYIDLKNNYGFDNFIKQGISIPGENVEVDYFPNKSYPIRGQDHTLYAFFSPAKVEKYEHRNCRELPESQCQSSNSKIELESAQTNQEELWDNIVYEDIHDMKDKYQLIDWLKKNYNSPTKL